MKPVLYNIYAIDATRDNDILFIWNGLQAIGSSLIIRNIETNTIVKTINHSSYALQTTIPKGTLCNGNTYSAEIQVRYTDTNGNEVLSDTSTAVQFKCYDTPTLSIKGFSSTGINQINTASLNINIIYDTEHEDNLLEKYSVFIYSDSYCTQLLRAVQNIYTKGDLSNLFAYIGSLSTGNTYYIVVRGTTNYNMTIQSEIYTVHVTYNTDINSVLQAQVNKGHVVLTFEPKNVVGEWEGTGSKYNNGYAIVDSSSDIVFDNNWNAGSNFTLIIKVKNPVATINTTF